MKLKAHDSFTREKIAEVGLSFDEIYEELPVEIVNTGYLRALIWQMQESASIQPSFASFDLSTNAFLEKNLSMLLDTVGNLQQEQTKLQNYQRNLARQQSTQQSLLNKRVRHNPLQKHISKHFSPSLRLSIEIE